MTMTGRNVMMENVEDVVDFSGGCAGLRNRGLKVVEGSDVRCLMRCIVEGEGWGWW